MDPLKSLLVDIGSRCGQRTLHFLSSSVNYLEVGHWMKSEGFYTSKRLHHRRELFHQIAEKVGEKKSCISDSASPMGHPCVIGLNSYQAPTQFCMALTPLRAYPRIGGLRTKAPTLRAAEFRSLLTDVTKKTPASGSAMEETEHFGPYFARINPKNPFAESTPWEIVNDADPKKLKVVDHARNKRDAANDAKKLFERSEAAHAKALAAKKPKADDKAEVAAAGPNNQGGGTQCRTSF
jgi:hypothetical protein